MLIIVIYIRSLDNCSKKYTTNFVEELLHETAQALSPSYFLFLGRFGIFAVIFDRVLVFRLLTSYQLPLIYPPAETL